MSSGHIVQIIGAVIDVEFPRDSVPNVYDALLLEGGETTLEVQQQLGDGIVRTIAMGSTEGLKRGLDVNSTGKAIHVPVSEQYDRYSCLIPLCFSNAAGLKPQQHHQRFRKFPG